MHFAFLDVVISLSAYGMITFLIARRNKKRLEEENIKVNKLLKGAEGLAKHDALTGLYNRRGMLEVIETPEFQEKHIAILEMDIDKFKQVNDTFGHQVGDELLIKVSELLKETFRAEDIIVRMGGDEFLVILPEFKFEHADIIKKKIYDFNKKLQNPTDDLPAVTVSAGVAFSVQEEKDELMIKADKALYKMKEKGRCGCCVYEEEFQ